MTPEQIMRNGTFGARARPLSPLYSAPSPELIAALELAEETIPKDALAAANLHNDLQRIVAPELCRDPLTILADVLGRGQMPMRRKQGIMKPIKLAVLTALCYRGNPPPALLVRFDNHGVKTTEALAL